MCVIHEEEDTCVSYMRPHGLRRRIHVCHTWPEEEDTCVSYMRPHGLLCLMACCSGTGGRTQCVPNVFILECVLSAAILMLQVVVVSRKICGCVSADAPPARTMSKK